MVDISDISVFTDNSDLDKKVGTWATKAELKREWDKTAKLLAIYSSYFEIKFNLKMMEHIIIYYFFLPVYKNFKIAANKMVCQKKVLNLLLNVIIALIQVKVILIVVKYGDIF